MRLKFIRQIIELKQFRLFGVNINDKYCFGRKNITISDFVPHVLYIKNGGSSPNFFLRGGKSKIKKQNKKKPSQVRFGPSYRGFCISYLISSKILEISNSFLFLEYKEENERI